MITPKPTSPKFDRLAVRSKNKEKYVVYNVSTGVIQLVDPQAGVKGLGVGYSGHGSFINDPSREAEAGLGPIPVGVWKMGRAVHHQNLGPAAIPLSPFGHNARGRTEFFIHGDNGRGDRSASRGCIVLPRYCRTILAGLVAQRINCLEVVP